MGPDNVTHTTKYDGIVVQSSLLGISIPKGWGTNKVGCNLMDYLDFSAKQTSSGKGGANPQYTYKATLVLGIVQGPISGIRTIYKDQAIFTATASGSKEVNGTTITISSKTPEQAAGITEIFTGEIGQAPWTYLETDAPTHAIGYSGICYAAAYHYPLDTSATSPNHNFEVQFAIRATIEGAQNDDANPADIVNDLLPDVPRWPANAIGDLTPYSTYCLAQGLLLSPIADNGRQASDLLTEIMTCSNSDCLWSDGQLKVVPYGDTTITNNGVTYAPNLTPVYALGWDDIIPNSSGEDPIQWDLTRTLEAYNYVQVNFLDRTLQYATNTATAVDQANINAFGRRQQSPQEFDSVCLMATASTLAQLMVQRSANVRRTAQFSVSELFGLLDPMDLITVPLRDGGNRLVRIVEANEQSDGSIQLQVEEMLVGAAHAAEYTRQDALGIASDFNVSPGDANPPAIINPPLSLTNGANEVWIMASGGPQWGGAVVWASFDGDTYQTVGTITAPGRYGVTTTDFPVSSDPDTTQTLGVSLVESGAALTAGTDADADNQVTLCAVGTEIIAYSSAVLTGASTYNLGTYIRRGLEGTTIADQPAGSLFMRLDGSQVAIPYTQGQIGKTVYVKLQSFNLYGGAYEDLDLCTAYEFIAEPNGANVVDVTWASLTGIPSLLTNYVSSGGTSVSTGNVPGGATFGGGSTTAAQVLTASEAATNNIAIQTGQISALTTEIGTANTNISNLTATYGDTESAAASAAAAAGYSYASSLAANTAATYESGAYSYQQGASNYSTDAGNYATDAYNQFIAAEAQAGAANTSAGEASGYSASAGNSAAAAQQSASISASVGLGTYTKSPTFADDANPTGVPTNWTDWSNGAANCTRVSGLNSPYAVQFESYGQSYGFYQSFSGLTAGSWVVLEAQIAIPYGGPSGSGFAGAGVLLNVFSNGNYVGSYVLSFYSDPDVTGAVNNEGVGDGRVYTFSKLIQVLPGATGALTGQLYAMSKFSGLPGVIVDEEVVHIWYRCDIRPASEAEIQGGQAYVTANETLSSFNSFVGAQDSTNTSLISQVDSLNAAVFDGSSGTLQSQITDLNAAQASQTSSFAQSIDTLTAQLQTGVNLVQNPDFQLGLTIGWTCISGSAVFDNPPYLGMIWNPGPAGTQSYVFQIPATSSVAPFDVSAGQPYAIQALFYSGGIGAATTYQRLWIVWLDGGGAAISSAVAVQANVSQGWHTLKADETTTGALIAPTGAVRAYVYCSIESSSGDVVTTGDNLVWGQIQVEQSSYCTPYKNSLLTASVQQNSAAIATVEGALYGSYTLQVEAGNVVTGLQLLSESGSETISDVIFQAENFLIKSSSASSAATPFAYNAETGVLTLQDVVASELSALSADLGTITAGYLSNEADTTFLDLDNGRSQYQVPGAAYALRMGTLGSGVTLWYGLASIAIGSETATNGVWSFGTNGVVYYGATALSTGASAFQKGAAGSLGAPTGAYAGGINAAFAAIPSSGYFNVSATLTPPGAGNPYNSGTAGQSGNWQIVATSSGGSQVLASGTWRSTAYVSGEGASITMDGAGVTNSTLCTLTGAVTVTFELQTTSSVGSSWQGTLNAQWIAQG